MHYLFTDTDPSEVIEIYGDEARHAKVLRLKADESVGLLNGKGRILITKVLHLGKDQVTLGLVDTEQVPASISGIHIAIPPTKQMDRFEWLVEKATELGVQEITPLICDNSERVHFNPGRIQKIILSALKQCGRPWLPVLHELTTFRHLVQNQRTGTMLVAHVNGTQLNRNLVPATSPITICVGPEGDFSGAELTMIKELLHPMVSLGKYRLRTETAALYMAAQFMNMDI
ncbi:MAG: RsmE family RNA methyltransferase [Saprospiraceae bacterium]